MNNNESLWIEQAFKYTSDNGEIRYLTIQEVDHGWDYSVYDEKYSELDTGVYDNPNTVVKEVISIIENESGLTKMAKDEIDYDNLMHTINDK